jgi:glyoxylase-like metal-dependent hydrolase (beta-lactamase superfamily II)
MTTNPKLFFRLIGMAMAVIVGPDLAGAQVHKPPKAPKSVRLYIFDCGVIHTTNGDAYSLKKEEMASTEMSIPCILVAHPKGTLMWDNGYIPDRAFPPGGGQATSGVVTPIPRSDPANYSELKTSKTILLDKDEWDVFGDGTAVIKSTPGHTPGHNVLFLKLKKTGPVVLSGDLYHYPEERTLNRLPVADFNKEQTAASRAELEDFLKKTGARLWIEHDIIANAQLKKAPAFYD